MAPAIDGPPPWLPRGHRGGPSQPVASGAPGQRAGAPCGRGGTERGQGMKQWIPAVVIALPLLVPVLAEAACAWVLWGDVFPIVGRGEPHCLVDSAASTESECLRRRGQKLKLLSTTPSPSEGLRFENQIDTGGTVSQETYRGADLVRRDTIHLVCLPDTVDPRGPKGGGR